MDHMSDYDECG